jgi:hypothetical protein
VIDDFKLMGEDWVVYHDPETDLELTEQDKWAETSARERIVKIRPESPPAVMVHELIHVAERVFTMDLSEEDVHRIAVGLWMLHVENPGLMRKVFK